MKILDWYIIRKFIFTFFFVVVLCGVIIVVIDFADKVDNFLEKQIPFSIIIGQYYFNFLQFLINLLSPICVFLAVIIFTSRLTQDSEIVAILSSGISFYRLLAPYLAAATFIMLLSFLMHGFIVPEAVRKWKDFEYEYIKKDYLWNVRQLHRKIDKESFAYIYNFNQLEKTGQNLTIEGLTNGSLTMKLQAQKMKWDEFTQKWKLEKVVIRHIRGEREWLEQRESMDTTLKLKPSDIWQRENYAESLQLPELLELIEQERDRGSDFVGQLELEKNERIAIPFATIILTIIGVSLSTRKRRGGIALQIGIGLIISFAYVLILSVAKVALADYFPVWLTLWVPNIVFGTIAIVLLRLAPK